ncbi:MAG: Holliday junction ATP-dependent DNA helicase RuvA [Chitinophagales bacterium]|nr:MAG: Holliday junction ATP-dependent DNA helicase RuvA [Chitinophagales bacterium]
MIGYIKGTLTFKSPAYVLLESGGIGYHIFISLHTFTRIQHTEQCKLLTYLHITDSAHTLYGFADEVEKYLFTQLITVSGVGPSTARLALSSLSPEELHKAIVQGNERVIQGIKGIGPKTAKRIILELKDKLVKMTDEIKIQIPSGNSLSQEALSALVTLGFNKSQAEKAIDDLLRTDKEFSGVEDLIKKALKLL